MEQHFFLFCLGILVVPPMESQMLQSNIITFFACSKDDNLTSPEDVEQCGDLLAYVGAEVARELVASKLRLDFNNVRLDFVATSSENFVETFRQFEKIAQAIDLRRVRALICPLTLEQMNAVDSLFFGNIVLVSYSISSDLIRNFQRVKRTVPSKSLINGGRLALLTEYNWIRAGILYSSEDIHVEAALEFETMFSYTIGGSTAPVLLKSLGFDGEHEIEEQLLALQLDEMKIILGFFGPEEARLILCKARDYQLTTAAHVWILPAYSNPNWWKRNTSSCTDQDMLDILQSTIFVDGVKIPPLDISLSQFTSQLLDKTIQLFPHLEPMELLPLLLHSRAVNAYDAVTSIANSIIASPRRTDPSLLECILECEECRIYTPIFADDDVSGNCSIWCPEEHNATTLCSEGHDERDSTSDAYAEGNLHYGQVMYTQFINGHHCPMALWWGTANSTRARENFRRVSELADCECEDEDILNDMAAFFRTYTDTFNCSPEFVWKDEDNPPVALIIELSSINTAAFAVTGVVICLGMLLAISFCILNVVLRNNKIMKASSPYLNLIILTGYILLLPNIFFLAIVRMGNHYPEISTATLSTFCALTSWLILMGFCLILSTILVKTWRLYWIFSRKKMSIKPTKTLNDAHLALGVAILTSVIVILLIVDYSVGRQHYTYSILPLPFRSLQNQIVSFKSLNLTHCSSVQRLNTLVSPSLAFAYFSILATTSLLFIICNKRIYSNFRDDMLYSFRALVLSSIMLVLAFTAYVAFAGNVRLYDVYFWILVASLVGFNVTSQAVTFFPLVYKVYRTCRREVALKSQERHNDELLSQFCSATAEEKLLRKELADKEKAITELKAKAAQSHKSVSPEASVVSVIKQSS